MNIEKLKRELKRYDDLLDKLTIENAGETYGSDEWASAMVQIISNIKDIKKKLEQLKHDKYQEPDRVSKSEITPSTKITMHKEKHDFDPETNMCLNCGFNKTVEAEKYTPNPKFCNGPGYDYEFPISEDLNLPLENETKEQKSRRL